jgi:hypothetical protein
LWRLMVIQAFYVFTLRDGGVLTLRGVAAGAFLVGKRREDAGVVGIGRAGSKRMAEVGSGDGAGDAVTGARGLGLGMSVVRSVGMCSGSAPESRLRRMLERLCRMVS